MRKRFVELLPPDQAEIKKNRSQRQFSPDDFSDDDDAELRKSERLVDDLKIEELRELVTQIQNGATFFKLVGGVAANLAITTSISKRFLKLLSYSLSIQFKILNYGHICLLEF